MKAVYCNSGALEAEVKRRFCFPEFIMMENAAACLEKTVFEVLENKYSSVKNPRILILCGSGNNGADGLALARRIHGKTAGTGGVSGACGTAGGIAGFGSAGADCSGESAGSGELAGTGSAGCVEVSVVLFSRDGNLRTEEGKGQLLMAQSVGVKIVSSADFVSGFSTAPELEENPPHIIIDCLYGTGFKGSLSDEISHLFEKINSLPAVRIACDIPSGIDSEGKVCSRSPHSGEKIAFKADYTVTMGVLKTSLFTDSAKDFTGKIRVADLGVSAPVFESGMKADAFLFEREDQILPYRTKPSSHKGNYGHVAVLAGEKMGAGIIASEAALKFGAGFSSLVTAFMQVGDAAGKDGSEADGRAGNHHENSFGQASCFSIRPENFKISPEIMVSSSVPETCNCILAGSGFGRNQKLLRKAAEEVLLPFLKAGNEASARNARAEESAVSSGHAKNNRALVLDADFFYYEGLKAFLEELNELFGSCAGASGSLSGNRVILTPHPKELFELAGRLGLFSEEKPATPADLSAATEPLSSGEPLLKPETQTFQRWQTSSEAPSLADFIENRFSWAQKIASVIPNMVLLSKGAVNYIFYRGQVRIVSDGTSALAKAGSGDVLAGLCASLLAQGYSPLDAACTACSVHANASKKAEPDFSLTPLSLIASI